MKVDLLTVGAVGFAGFALWYVLRNKSTATGLTEAQAAMYGMSTTQRQQSGAALWQNSYTLMDLINSLNYDYSPETATRRSDYQ